MSSYKQCAHKSGNNGKKASFLPVIFDFLGIRRQPCREKEHSSFSLPPPPPHGPHKPHKQTLTDNHKHPPTYAAAPLLPVSSWTTEP